MFRPPKPASMTLNLAPMVDVMMCLIIFFLLASTMVARENFAMDLPFAVTAAEKSKDELGNRVVINVLHGEERGVEETRYAVVQWTGTQVAEVMLAPGDVEQFVADRARAARERGKELTCVIRADEDAWYADVEVVLRAAGKAQIADVVFAANRGTGPTE
jgi:biopolymer transport protein ExbD